MAKWDDMDKQVWNNSEVMKNFEKNIIDKVMKLDKIVEAQQGLGTAKKTVTDINTGLAEAGERVGKLVGSADDDEVTDPLANQQDFSEIKQRHDAWLTKQNIQEPAESLVDDQEECCQECEGEEVSDEEHEGAKDSLLGELTSISEAAADSGNIKLAYMIERTISEMFGE